MNPAGGSYQKMVHRDQKEMDMVTENTLKYLFK